MIKHMILGIIQGLTEFLPVSSSGHLVIMQRLSGIFGHELALVVVLHLGTTLALIIFFFKDIIKAVGNIKLLSFIAIVTLITGIIGALGKDFFESLFSSPKIVACALLFTGIILILSRTFMDAKRQTPGIKDAIILGLAQAIAIIPGISRSGLTISTLLFRKLNRETAFRLSFLASIPAVLGVAVLELRQISVWYNLELKNFTIGFIFSFLTGLLSLRILKIIMMKAKLHYFGYYCILVGIITFLFIR